MEKTRTSTHELLISQDYKLIDEAWDKHGRLTYIHDEDANPVFVKALFGILRRAGWEVNASALRTLRHTAACCVIELEPGGSETTGHFLHYMKASKTETPP